jgi:hypothetical protein
MFKQVAALLLFASTSFPQVGDSLKFQNISPPPDTITTNVGDTTSIRDTSKIQEVSVQKDTLVPIQGRPLTDVSTIIDKRTFLFENYRYTGDLLRSFSFNFIKDLGFVGYNHETFIYGVGNNGISYFQDGVLLNNRFTNLLDLNLVQSEDIDSIEIVPTPRGFFYGPYNNPVTVNFITKDFITKAPYSRIKYYQGPDGEAMIDGMFSAKLADRWNFAFQLTNRSKDETYTNTDLSIWQFNTKLKYFLSNSINLLAFYYYVDALQGMNGGVDYDSLSRSSDDPNSDLYDPFAAPVLFPNSTLDVTQHNVGLRTLVKPFDDSQLDLSFYYRYGLDEFRDFRDSLNIHYEDKSKTYGGVLNYYYKFDIITLQALGDYESTNHDDEVDNFERYGFCGILSASFLDNFIQPSVFYKRSYWGNDFRNNVGGIGGDIIFHPAQNQSLYIGYSLRESIYTNEENIPCFEIGTNYKSMNLMLDIKYFSTEYFYRSYLEGGYYVAQNIRGLGLNLNFKIWLLLFETNSFYYFKVERDQYFWGPDYGRPLSHPDWQFIGGLFVNELFFDNNLDLKTGFKFYYTGKINSFEGIWYSYIDVAPSNKLDFTLAGEIKKVAIVYFIWENLFNKEYYITPYYPMPERNIRFGLAWELFN